jgi:hypothetical protein
MAFDLTTILAHLFGSAALTAVCRGMRGVNRQTHPGRVTPPRGPEGA